MPRPESFGVEEMFGNGNDNVPVKGDFRVRLAAAERARSTRRLLPLLASQIWHPSKTGDRFAREVPSFALTHARSLFPRTAFRPREQATTAPPPPRADPTASVIRRSAEWRSGETADGLGLSRDERDFLTELAAKRELVTDRARYAEYATAASTGQRPMPVARPATAPPAEERRQARLATTARRAPAPRETPPRREEKHQTRRRESRSRAFSPPLASASPFDTHPNEPPATPMPSASRPRPSGGVAFADPGKEARSSPERSERSAAHGSAIERTSASPTADRIPSADPSATTAPRRLALFAPLSADERPATASDANCASAADERETADATRRERRERVDEATAPWRDSLRGARLRRAAARGSVEPSSSSALRAARSPDASPAIQADPTARRHTNENENETNETLLSPRGPALSLEHLDALRLTADERAFLARLAKERALVTDRARHGAAAAAAADVHPRGASPLRASLPDPIVAQPSPLTSPPAGSGADDARAGKPRGANRGASPLRFARAAFGDDVAIAASWKKSPARRYGGPSAGAGAVVTAGWRPSPARETIRAGASRERPTTAAARMSREHARDMWLREPGEEDGSDFDVKSAARRATAANPEPDLGAPPTRDLATLEALVVENEASETEPTSEGFRPTPSSASPARASFERARPPARASWGPGDAARRAYRPDVYSRGFGVSISGVLGDARLVRGSVSRAETGNSADTPERSPDPEWEWQSSWQREWQTSLESPETRRERELEKETHVRAAEKEDGFAASPAGSPVSPRARGVGAAEATAVSDSTPKSLAETIRARADADDGADDSPAWTLSPSPDARASGREGEDAASARASPPRRALAKLSMSPAAPLAAEPFPRLGAGSYRERRDARKASKAFASEDAGGGARTGLDVRGDTSGAAVFY